MHTTYTHSRHGDGTWHVIGPEIDYAHSLDADGHHAELIASLLTLAYAAGRRDMVREMTEAKEVNS